MSFKGRSRQYTKALGCDNCEGHGDHPCFKCRREGCVDCNYSGFVTCEICGGSGKIVPHSKRYKPYAYDEVFAEAE